MTRNKTWAAAVGLMLAGGASAHGGHGTENPVHDLGAELLRTLQGEPSLTLWLASAAVVVGLALARLSR
ncbi:hypothetical protein [Leptothrix discophora]|uniref:Uncharacterized protein n=1 Tax=Leptothrix discophora TaxID=89 RepID=A0ABT9G1B0_LEPDI|nr:hypothetical protein [Leptothrix discophora]MDP4300279.1 hypothetical protein [Leptothrix discophora]